MSTPAEKTPIAAETFLQLENAILQPDLKKGQRILEEIITEHGYEILISKVFEPLFAELGERRKRNEISLAQSYVTSMMVDGVLRAYHASRLGAAPTAIHGMKGPVVLANIEDDCHPLGRKIVSTLLQIENWDVRDLGIDVEAKTIVEKAVEARARVIGVSAMIFTTAENVRKVREEIDARGYQNKIRLAVGGAVFRIRPDLAEHVGADGTAPNAFAALQLFADLWQKAEEW